MLAMDLGYLDTLILFVHLDENGPNDWFEANSFALKHSGKTQQTFFRVFLVNVFLYLNQEITIEVISLYSPFSLLNVRKNLQLLKPTVGCVIKPLQISNYIFLRLYVDLLFEKRPVTEI